MKVDFLTCDVFTERPFAGNPLLVVPDARGLAKELMQAIAREINYSESTFVLPPDDPRHAYRQRTFVPFKEIPYAGHPTVGTAIVMAALGKVGAKGEDEITIEVGSGPLTLELIRLDGAVRRVRMSQGKPVWEQAITDADLRKRLAAAIGLPKDALHRVLAPQVVSTGNRTLVIPLASVADVSAAVADVRTLNALEKELDVLIAYVFAFFLNDKIKEQTHTTIQIVPVFARIDPCFHLFLQETGVFQGHQAGHLIKTWTSGITFLKPEKEVE